MIGTHLLSPDHEGQRSTWVYPSKAAQKVDTRLLIPTHTKLIAAVLHRVLSFFQTRSIPALHDPLFASMCRNFRALCVASLWQLAYTVVVLLHRTGQRPHGAIRLHPP